jgi:hypothetical protein
MDIPRSEWGDTRKDTLAKAVERAEAESLWFDNGPSRGVVCYLATVQLPGFEPLRDAHAWLTAALRGISPPPVKGAGRYRPYGGTRKLTQHADAPVDENARRYRIIAKRSGPTDWAGLEAELRERGIAYEIGAPVYRGQFGFGISFASPDEQSARDFFVSLGYQPVLPRAG